MYNKSTNKRIYKKMLLMRYFPILPSRLSLQGAIKTHLHIKCCNKNRQMNGRMSLRHLNSFLHIHTD